MNIVVALKEVPDTYEPRKIDLATGIADRAASERVADEIGDRALEVALSYADAHPGTHVTVLTMAPASAESTLRKALAKGADDAIHVRDDGLAGADLTRTAAALAAAIRKTGFDLVITGNMSTDGTGGVIPAMLAELLDVPEVTALQSVELTDVAVNGRRTQDGLVLEVGADLPAVISITEALPDPRLAGFKGVMAAKKKPLAVWSIADLGVDDEDAASRSIVVGARERPARSAGQVIVDEGDGGQQLVAFLAERGLV